MCANNFQKKALQTDAPLRILSLDGGGVRGYSMLVLLQKVMHRTYVELHGCAPRKEDIPKPCDHFDLIIGTGTGGLIAILLGRLRLDIETSKRVYIEMTRRVFENDNTVAGLSYRSTLFKASLLEDAIQSCLQDPNESIYDYREQTVKTAVVAVYKDTPLDDPSMLIRSYDSRQEPAHESECTIWQAGRATCAINLLFKPITIGQSVFFDEGAGRHNPSVQVLDEAVVREWPGREVGLFLSLGTGKLPAESSLMSKNSRLLEQLVYSQGSLPGEVRQLMESKLDDCERSHQYMLREHLSHRRVNVESYFRLNVEMGVGDFAINEWSRIPQINMSTHRYLSKPEVQRMTMKASARLAAISRAPKKMESSFWIDSNAQVGRPFPPVLAAELPAPLPAELPAKAAPSYNWSAPRRPRPRSCENRLQVRKVIHRSSGSENLFSHYENKSWM